MGSYPHLWIGRRRGVRKWPGRLDIGTAGALSEKSGQYDFAETKSGVEEEATGAGAVPPCSGAGEGVPRVGSCWAAWRLNAGWGRQQSGAVISLGKDGLWFGSEDRNGLKLGKKEIRVEELADAAVRGTLRKVSTGRVCFFHTALGGSSFSTPPSPPPPSLAFLYLPSPCFCFPAFYFSVTFRHFFPLI